MKILYVTTIGSTMNFFPEHIKMLRKEGHEVELACNTTSKVKDIYYEWGLKIHHVPFSRSPLSKDNIIACRELKKIVEAGNYDIIHTHTPNASACVRLVCRKYRKNGLKVFYTAHGFHFFKGAPLKNWLLYYPVEWLCSFWTDKLITINKEDYERAKKHMYAKAVEYIPSIGLKSKEFLNDNIEEYSEIRKKVRDELGILPNEIGILSVGELAERKNQQVVIKAIKNMKDLPIKYFLCGNGPLYENYSEMIRQYNLENKVFLLGIRNDVSKLLKAMDIFIHPSVREGFGMAPVEAMASGLPLISSYVNGMKDYTEDGKTGICIKNPRDEIEMKNAIEKMIEDEEFRKNVAEYNVEVAMRYDIEKVLIRMKEIYEI